MSNWSSTQHKVFESITEKRKNILLTGPAGAGKSEVIKNIVKFFKSEKKKIGVTAVQTTASLFIGGTTLHSYMHLTNERLKLSNSQILQEVLTITRFVNSLKNLECLIIDQIDLVDLRTFELIDMILREVKQESLPFGGLQMVFVGDFYKTVNQKKYIFQTQLFWDCIDEMDELKDMYRQTDLKFVGILNRIRRNKMNDEDVKLINECVRKAEIGPIIPTLFLDETSRLDVHTENLKCLDALDGDDYPFPVFYGKSRNTETEKLCSIVNPVESLKIGSQVMLCHNLNVDEGLICGIRGVVVGFTEKNVDEKTDFLKIETKWYLPKDVSLPIVQFLSGQKLKIPYFKETKEEGESFIWRIGLQYAWYTNIYISEGLTLDCVRMNLNKQSQPYLALSRVKSLDNFFLEEGITRRLFQIDKAIIDFYDFPFHLQKNLSSQVTELASEKEILEFLQK